MPKRTRGFLFHDIDISTEDGAASLSQPPPPTHRHTSYSSHDGLVSASTTYYSLPLAKRRCPPPAELTIPTADENYLERDFFEELLAEGLDANNPFFLDTFVDDKHSPRKRTAGDHPLCEWIPQISEFLDEIIRLEGRCGLTTNACAKCQDTSGPLYRCSDCQDLSLYCGQCLQDTHLRHPFHRIYQWVHTHFRRVFLRDIGIRIQLGHQVGQKCINPMSPAKDFVVIDIGGIHEVSLDFCGCETAESRTMQLLRARLLPATSMFPKSAATFRVLETFHLLSNQTKVSAFKYYTTLARRTCNTGVNPPKDRYVTFLRLVRMWQHLKLLKRSGRGHDPAGIDATEEGSCAVLCPACPHPGKNLPDNWESAPSSEKWLYTLFVGMDANFRLKRKKVSSDAADPGLNHGYAYFVQTTKYKDFLERFGTLQFEESSTCNNHDALKLAHMKGSHGTAASGVGCVECTRHDVKRPCSVGDLQKGEQYVNMDYLFFSSMSHHSTDMVVVSYDIACQWSRHIWSRLLQYERTFDWKHNSITFLIPKFHLPAHQSSCQTAYSFNLTINVGRTDGEAVERGWAAVNPFASSTKEMGPGSRRDVLDDIFGDYNWRKITQLPKTFLTKIKEAIDERNEQIIVFQEFQGALPETDVAQWKAMIEEWEKNPRKPNPFVATRPSITLAAARLCLAEEEAAVIAAGKSTTVHDKASASYMIASGLEYEGHQRRLRVDVASLGQHSTDLQRAKIQERRNMLQHQIDAWVDIQQLYMPGVAAHRSRVLTALQDSSPTHAENHPLLLPSAASSHVSCELRLLEHEWELRYGQAHETLDDLRRHLRLRTHMYKYKDRFIRGQRETTRARTTIATVEAKVTSDADRYRAAYAALESLAAPLLKTGWKLSLRPLLAEDIKGFEDDSSISRDRVRLSWIWKMPRIDHSGAFRTEDGDPGGDEDTQEALRIEWCKARARAARWREECRLLCEEMRRVTAFYTWHALSWKQQSNRHENVDSILAEGLFAYAYRQAEIRCEMQRFCEGSWACVREYVAVADAAIGLEGKDESEQS